MFSEEIQEHTYILTSVSKKKLQLWDESVFLEKHESGQVLKIKYLSILTLNNWHQADYCKK